MSSFEIISSGNCPRCGESNSFRVPTCKRCDYRLPWADRLEGVVTPPPQKSALEVKWEKLLTRLGLLPKTDCVCRYCGRLIDPDAIECRYCDRYITAQDRNAGPDQMG
jgi:ribosomal protein L40E